jgi:hypothetical protein
VKVDFPFITEMSLLGIRDHGIANRERVIFRPTVPVNLAQFGLVLGVKQFLSPTSLLPNTTLWLPDYVLHPPGWLFIYTGSGNTEETTVNETGEFALVLHWGLSKTVFQANQVVPVLVRINGVLIGANR